MKRMIRHAAENGFDRIAWTTGEQQADRYKLRKQVDDLRVRRRDDGKYSLMATLKGRSGLENLGDSVPESKLAETVGKELADKITQQGDGIVKYSGTGLKVGGEGMRQFYDVMLPNIVNKYAKKFGARVSQTSIPVENTNATVMSLKITPQMRDAAMQGQPLFSKNDKTLGATTPDGKMYLNLAALDKDSFDGVALHEGLHAVLKETIGESDYARLMQRMNNLRKLSKNGTGDVGKFFKEAEAAIPSDTKAEHLNEEMAAYTVEKYTNAPRSIPQSIAKWVKDFIAAIRVGLMRSLPQGSKLRGKLLDSATEADLARLAVVGLRRAARDQEASISNVAMTTESDIRYSKRDGAPGLDTGSDNPATARKKFIGLYTKVVDSLIDRIDHWTSPLSSLPQRERFYTERNLTQGEIAKWDRVGKQIAELFYKAGKKVGDEIYIYLTTRGASTEIISDPKLREVAVRAKAQITEIGKMLVDKGMIPEASRLKHEDAYLPRVYFAYLLNDDVITSASSGKRIGDKGWSKARKDIPAEVRDIFLGEIKDPGYLVSRAIAIPMRDLALTNWMQKISENPEWVMQNQMVEWTPPWEGESRRFSARELRDLAAKIKVFADEQQDQGTKKAALEHHRKVLDKAKEAGDKGMVYWNMPAELGQYIYRSKRVTPYWLKSQASSLRKRALKYEVEANKEAALRLADRMDAEANKVLEELDIDTDSVPDGYKQMPDTARYGALRGLIVKSEIHDDIVGVVSVLGKDIAFMQKMLSYGGPLTKLTQWFKISKVALNPPAQVRNFVNNMVMVNLSGVPLYRFPELFLKVLRDLKSEGKYTKIVRKHGTDVSTFAANEFVNIEKQLIELERQARDGVGIHTLLLMAGKVVNAFSNAYQGSEMLGKMMVIIDQMERKKTSENKAVNLANKWLFDYSEVNPNVRFLRNAPIGAPFITYLSKVMPRLLEVALKYPWRFAPYIGLYYSIPMLIAASVGASGDDMEALKKALPKWLERKGYALPLPTKDEHGRWKFVDIGYFFPWSALTNPIDIAKEGDIGEAIRGAGLLTGPVPDLIAAVSTGKDPFTKREISNDYDPPEKKALAWMSYLYGMMAPPWLVGMPIFGVDPTMKGFSGHLYDALTGHVDKYGDPTSTVPQALARFFGVNIYPVDPNITRGERLRRMKFEISETKRRMTDLLRNRNLSPDERRRITHDYNEQIRLRAKEMGKYVRESQVNEKLLRQ
jgi:hypothetical protein